MKQKRTVKRVLCALLLIVLFFVTVSMISSVIIFQAIYPRHDEPNAFTLRYEELDSAAYPREEISFSSKENRLTAYCYHCADPKGLVVIAAGMGDGASAHLSEMMGFIDGGFDVFCYDATGVGESEGKGIVGLSQPGIDLRAALDYIGGDEELNRLPVLLYAHSAGGYGAITCVGDYDRIKAAVVMCAFESPVELMLVSARERVGILADIEYPFMALENSFLFGEMADIRASERLKNCRIPVMLIEGEDDDLIPEKLRLSSYRDVIDNPLVSFREVDTGHSGLWLSDEAEAYREAHDGDSQPDLIKANETDSSFMREILTFYDDAIR